MPVLQGDRLIGRIDPKLDRRAKRLVVNNVYAEPDAPMNLETGLDVAAAIRELAGFLGVEDIDYSGDVPAAWRRAFD